MASATLTTINHKRIKPDPNNVRSKVSVAGVKDLAQSIEASGLQVRIILRPVEDHYMIIAGHRRMGAIGLLIDEKKLSPELPIDWFEIRAEDISEADVTVSQLIENLQREDISVLDEAAGYMRLLEFDMSQADIARKVGRARSHVTKRLALLGLPQSAQVALTKGEITVEHALAIAALDAEDAEAYCANGITNEYQLQRLLRGKKGKKAAAKLAADLAATGLTIVESIEETEVEDGFHFETQEVVWSEDWDGSVPVDSTHAVVEANGEQAHGRIYKAVENTTSKTPDKEEKRAEAEKAKRRKERDAERIKTDFLVRSLDKVKAADAQDVALSMVLDRAGYSNANRICALLDLEVPVKEESTYDGKTRNVKQYAPALFTAIKQARADGDIGFLRRVVLATACTYGYEERILALYGFDPKAEAKAAEADA